MWRDKELLQPYSTYRSLNIKNNVVRKLGGYSNDKTQIFKTLFYYMMNMFMNNSLLSTVTPRFGKRLRSFQGIIILSIV